jgi:quercetin dioxygenase-like cupin family protein
VNEDDTPQPSELGRSRPTPSLAIGSEHAPGVEQVGLFGGRGCVRVWDLLGAMPAAPFTAVLSCELEAGGRVGEHVQQRDAEIVIGVAGSGVAWVNGIECGLPVGGVVHLPKGSVLALENPNPEPFRYLIVKALPP